MGAIPYKNLTSWCVVFQLLANTTSSTEEKYLQLMCMSLDCARAAGGFFTYMYMFVDTWATSDIATKKLTWPLYLWTWEVFLIDHSNGIESTLLHLHIQRTESVFLRMRSIKYESTLWMKIVRYSLKRLFL